MSNFGGEMRFAYNGNPIVMRGTFKLDGSKFENEAIINQDGSISKSIKPMGYGAELTFEDAPGLDFDALLLGGPYNATVIEDHTGTVHTWTGAIFEGRPSVDRANGEVSGLKIRSRDYRKV